MHPYLILVLNKPYKWGLKGYRRVKPDVVGFLIYTLCLPLWLLSVLANELHGVVADPEAEAERSNNLMNKCY